MLDQSQKDPRAGGAVDGGTSTDAGALHAPTGLGVLRAAFGRVPWIAWALLVLCVVFSAINAEAFLTVNNFRNIALDTSVLLVLAVGATFIFVAGGIDLSIGSVLVFSSVLAARLLRDQEIAGWWGVLAALAITVASGAAWGLVNGAIVAYARVNPLITTLGTMGMALGLGYILADNGLDIQVRNEDMTKLGIDRLFGQVPYLVLIAAVVALVGGIVLAQTRFGRHTAGIGSNREAAERVGIDVPRHLLKVYCMAGALSGLGGFMSLVRFSTTTITGHANDVLAVVSGVILGGTSLFGGIGTMVGTVVGMFIPSVLANGFVIAGVVPFWQQVAVGAVLIVAVYVDQIKRSRRD